MNELRPNRSRSAPPHARGAVEAVGARVSWRARVTSQATTGSSPEELRPFGPERIAVCSFRGTMPPVPGIHFVGITTASHNMAVNPDALRRPPAAPAPDASRRLRLRYAA